MPLRCFPREARRLLGHTDTPVDDTALAARIPSQSKTAPLMRIPIELRLMINESVLESNSAVAFDEFDEFDAEKLLSYRLLPKREHHARKTYSWIFTSPTIFREALPLICATHRLIFRHGKGLRQYMRLGHLAKTRIVKLVATAALRDETRNMLFMLRCLPSLRHLDIVATMATFTCMRIPPQWSGFHHLRTACVLSVKCADPSMLLSWEWHADRHLDAVAMGEVLKERIRLISLSNSGKDSAADAYVRLCRRLEEYISGRVSSEALRFWQNDFLARDLEARKYQ